MQCLFIYPYNEVTPALQPAKLLETLKLKEAGSHEGDLEFVEIYLSANPINPSEIKIDRMYFARHGGHGGFAERKDLEFFGSHPIVYAAKYGHASYPKAVPVVNKLADTADGQGPRWKTWEHYEIYNPQNPPPGQEWAKFEGKLGTTRFQNKKSRGYGEAPSAPFERSWLRKQEDPREKQFLTIDVKTKKGKDRASANFNLDPDIRAKTIMWKINHPDKRKDLKKIKFSLMKDVPVLKDKTVWRYPGGTRIRTGAMKEKKVYIGKVEGVKPGESFQVEVYTLD